MTSSTTTAISGNLNLDLENKLVNPSVELYTSMKTLFGQLYLDSRNVLIEVHDTTAVLAKQFYDDPVATTAEWYNQTVELGTEMLAEFKAELLPEFKAIYDISKSDLQAMISGIRVLINDFSAQLYQVGVDFYDHPSEMLTSWFNQIQSFFSDLALIAVEKYQAIISGIQPAIQSLARTWEHFLNAPQATAQEIYYAVASGLLDIYAQIISSVLQLM